MRIFLSKHTVLIISIAVIAIISVSTFLFITKYKADSGSTVLLADNFDASSRVLGRTTENDPEALSGSQVLALRSGTTRIHSVSGTCQALINNYSIAKSLPNKTYSVSFGMKGTITGQQFEMRMEWKERSGLSIINKSMDRPILPSDISNSNWTIVSQIVATSNSFVSGSLVVMPVVKCANSDFAGAIDSFSVNEVVQSTSTTMIGYDANGTKIYGIDYVKSVIPLNSQIDKSLQSIKISGSGQFLTDTAGINVVLQGTDGSENLVTEKYNFAGKGTFTFDNLPVETAALDNIKPQNLIIYAQDSQWSISNIALVLKETKLDSKTRAMISAKTASGLSPKNARDQVNAIYRSTAANNIISGLNTYIAKHNLNLKVAMNDRVTQTYTARSNQLGTKYLSANTQMIDSYNSGYLTMRPEAAPTIPADRFPSEFTWTNRDGQNWLTSIKNQSTCGSCYAFAAVAQIEAAINIKYNQHINADLSEQQAMCGSGGCNSGFGNQLLGKFVSTPLMDESLNPYKAADDTQSCTINQPATPQGWENAQTGHPVDVAGNYPGSINGHSYDLMNEIMKYGPIAAGFGEFGHVMLVAGWTTIDNKLTWIIKNSWGSSWGTNLNMSTPKYTETHTPLAVAPTDKCPEAGETPTGFWQDSDGTWQIECSKTQTQTVSGQSINVPANPLVADTKCPDGLLSNFIILGPDGTPMKLCHGTSTASSEKSTLYINLDPLPNYNFTCPAGNGDFQDLQYNSKSGAWSMDCLNQQPTTITTVSENTYPMDAAPAGIDLSCPASTLGSISLDDNQWNKNCNTSDGGYLFYQTGGMAWSASILGIKATVVDTFPFHFDSPSADVHPVGTTPIPSVACVDNDGDGYYSWGIGPKPSTCPAAAIAVEDCDDSNPTKTAVANNSCNKLPSVTITVNKAGSNYNIVYGNDELYKPLSLTWTIRSILGSAVGAGGTLSSSQMAALNPAKTIIWNGEKSNGSALSHGVYLISLALTNQAGKVINFSSSFTY